MKIDNNPYARAFRDTIQSEGSNHGAGKKGGHIRIPSKQTSPHPLIRHMYIPSPVVCTSIGSSTCSATSIESGILLLHCAVLVNSHFPFKNSLV